MTQTTRRLATRVYEKEFPITKYLGRNSFGSHSVLSLNESRELLNLDIFAGESARDDDQLRSRQGTTFLRAASGPTKRGSIDIVNGITWDIGDEEYLITQEGTSFYAQALLTPSNPVLIALLGGGAFTLGSSASCEMFLNGDRIYVFHPEGNKIIEWDTVALVFKGRTMGMVAPVISAVTSATAGVIKGSYTLGVEKCYFNDVGERIASTPNRFTAGRIIANTGTISSKKIKVTIQATELDNDSTWTHIRLWRSKNKNVDLTDTLNPIDAQGLESELYEEALITRAEIGLVALTSVATGSTLPQGNAGTQAGKPSGVYTIEVNNLDTVLFDMVDIDRIDLVPLPPASTGCFQGSKIFVSAINDTSLDDQSKNNIYYSNYADTKYSEQYNPLNFIVTGRDGQNMIKLLAFEDDLIGIKESKTGRLPGGNIDLDFDIIDHKIGISTRRFALYIPAIGICAITNDNHDFRVLGYDMRWTNTIHGMDISKPIRVEAANFSSLYTSFFYVNGKLMISDGLATVYALHEKEKRGWTVYEYPMNSLSQLAFTFANNSRAAIASKNTYLVEIETGDTDVSTVDDTYDNVINCEETTARFNASAGRYIIEHAFLEVSATLNTKLRGVPYVNGLAWPSMTSGSETDFTPDPAVYATFDALQDGAYRLFLEPAEIGEFLWNRPMGNYIHYILRTTAPCVIKRKVLNAVVDEDGISFGNFDPFQVGVAQEDDLNELFVDGGVDDETITDEIDGSVDDETVLDEIDGDIP